MPKRTAILQTGRVLTVEVTVATARHEIIEHVEWEQRISEFTEVQLQNAGNRVDVLSIQVVQQRIFSCYTRNRISLSLSLSLHFNEHFPDGPGLAGTRISPFFVYVYFLLYIVHYMYYLIWAPA